MKNSFGVTAWAILALVTGLAVDSLPAAAQGQQAPKELGKFGDWEALSYKENKSDVCYAASFPTKEDGHKSKAGETNILVTHWPAQKRFSVVSISAGYVYKKGSTIEVEVGKERFRLHANGKTAWAQDGDDEKIVKAMKAGYQLTARGTMDSGKTTTDIYSLRGFSKALDAASKACAVKE